MEKNEVEVVQPDVLDKIIQAETQSQVDIAKKYPRQLASVKDQFRALATISQETAKSCFYAKPVDVSKGVVAEGPSIRMGEIITSVYGNIKYGSRVIEEAEKFVRVQGICADLEKNITFTSEIVRQIYSERKGRYSANLIQTTIQAASAIAIRNAIFKVIPLGLFEAEIKEVKKKAAGADTDEPLANRAAKAVAYFKKIKVPESRVFARLGVKNITEVTDEHLVTLHGIVNAINDEQTTLEEAFPTTKKEEVKGKTDQVVEDVKKKTSGK